MGLHPALSEIPVVLNFVFIALTDKHLHTSALIERCVSFPFWRVPKKKKLKKLKKKRGCVLTGSQGSWCLLLQGARGSEVTRVAGPGQVTTPSIHRVTQMTIQAHTNI
ncbi:hypothetical protein ILYODFUR_027466 [Ilyodon furcidens]|uniref:Uncharacterized protein n=1 Tax=Ilyodon furcidens TaxID=33524 RepID=A0ABV0TN85_9TELE